MGLIKLLNLQLFAADTVVNATGGYVNANTGTVTDFTAGNSLSAEMKTYYDTELIELMGPNLVHAQFAAKKTIPKGRGKKIEWRKWSNFEKATTPLMEGVTPQGKTMSVSTIETELDQYGDYVTITDVLELTAIDEVILEATDKHGENAGLTLDTVCRNKLHTGTNVIYAPIVSGSNVTAVTSRYALNKDAKISGTLVNMAATFLKKNNAPRIDGKYVCIIHPSVSFDLRECEQWIEAHKYADTKELFDGEIGELHGVRFVETTEGKIFHGADLASDSRTLLVNGTASGNTVNFDGGTVAVNALAGRKVLIENAMYEVVSNTETQLTLAETVSATDNAVIYPGEGGAEGCAVYGCLFLGKGAYGTPDIDGGGTEVIVKQKGSSGTADPLNQRSTVGWKSLFATEILIPEYILRLEVGSTYSDVDEAN